MQNGDVYPCQAVVRALRDAAGASPAGTRTQSILMQASILLRDACHDDGHPQNIAIIRAVSERIVQDMAGRMANRQNPPRMTGPSVRELEEGVDMAEDAFPPSAEDEDLS